jgi:excisionase family DNA binding protein
MKREILTPNEAAELFRVPLSWIYGHVGELPHFKIGRLLRFDRAELEAWFERKHRNGAEPPGIRPGGEPKGTPIQ